jgi:hypothetical protein
MLGVGLKAQAWTVSVPTKCFWAVESGMGIFELSRSISPSWTWLFPNSLSTPRMRKRIPRMRISRPIAEHPDGVLARRNPRTLTRPARWFQVGRENLPQ